MSEMKMNEIYDTVIIGGGVVGLAILREATLQGMKCALIEASSDLLTQASGSNSGIACTGVDAEGGTLERSLIRDSISRIRLFCKKFHIPYRECGSLVCLWPWDDSETENSLKSIAQESWDAGDTNVKLFNTKETLEKEPALSNEVQGSVHIPGEIVLDPWLFPIALASNARENGAQIYTDFPFLPETTSFQSDSKCWIISNPNSNFKLQTKSIINACGIQSDIIQEHTHTLPKPTWTAKPRRGQYRIFKSTKPLIHPIQPVPTPRTKGIFVYSTLYDHIVVGPTALDQSSRTDVTPDINVANQLTKHAQRLLSISINDKTSYVGEYVGIRPGTNHRDYQIHSIHHKQWISVAGIRSTGLTASLGIGSYVTTLLKPMIQYHPLTTSLNTTGRIKETPLPDVKTLAKSYRDSLDGTVNIHGYKYKVTHPITKIGWTHATGIAG